MTYLEKAMEIEREKGNEISVYAIMEDYCPSEYGFDEIDSCNETECECISCWNREMPNTEEKWVNQGVDANYNQGLNDAWFFFAKLEQMENGVIYEVFKCGHEDTSEIFEEYTPQEALAKMKAYEDSKIEVGDVVKSTLYVDMNCGIVTNITDNKADLVHKDGKFSVMMPLEFLVKTGKHIDIKSILEQIGE